MISRAFSPLEMVSLPAAAIYSAGRIADCSFGPLGRSTTRRDAQQTVTFLARWFLADSDVRLQSREKGQKMNRAASKSDFLSVRLVLACMISTFAGSTH